MSAGPFALRAQSVPVLHRACFSPLKTKQHRTFTPMLFHKLFCCRIIMHRFFSDKRYSPYAPENRFAYVPYILFVPSPLNTQSMLYNRLRSTIRHLRHPQLILRMGFAVIFLFVCNRASSTI